MTNCHQLKMRAADGKNRLTDVADTEQLLRIIQSIPSKKAEPFKAWLAMVGRERIEETIDPEQAIDRALETYLKKGYSEEWVHQRLLAIRIRNELTDEWKKRGGNVAGVARKAMEVETGKPVVTAQNAESFRQLVTDIVTDAAQLPERKRKEATDAYSVYEEIIKDNIEYDYLIQDRYLDRDRIEEILALILETVCTKRRTIRIAGDDHPAELVKAKFMKLNSEHIRFVLDCMQENTTKIRNIKQYMKAALFNAPSTIGSYYTSLVSHDMYGGRTIQSARSKGIPDYTCNEDESL